MVWISDLDATKPPGSGSEEARIRQGDNYIREIKSALLTSLPDLDEDRFNRLKAGVVTADPASLAAGDIIFSGGFTSAIPILWATNTDFYVRPGMWVYEGNYWSPLGTGSTDFILATVFQGMTDPEDSAAFEYYAALDDKGLLVLVKTGYTTAHGVVHPNFQGGGFANDFINEGLWIVVRQAGTSLWFPVACPEREILYYGGGGGGTKTSWGFTVSSAGSLTGPAGWSASRLSTGYFRVTHNLGTTNYGMAMQPQTTYGGNAYLLNFTSKASNYFEYVIVNAVSPYPLSNVIANGTLATTS